MNSEEYERLAAVEQRHWFYRGKRDIVLSWLKRLGALKPDSLLVDCGAGTGLFAAQASAFCRVLAVDDHDEALALAKHRLGESRVVRGTCTELPFEDSSADMITALDVLEHIEDDVKAVAEFARVLKPGGVLVVTVPALQLLWSDWDVALHHYRRYERGSLLRLLAHPRLETVHCNFVNVLAFPAVLAARRLRGLSARWKSERGTRIEERIPPRWLNESLYHAFVLLARQRPIKFPFGVGLLAVIRRR